MHLGFPHSISGTDFTSPDMGPAPQAGGQPKMGSPSRSDLKPDLPAPDLASGSASEALVRDVQHQLQQTKPGQMAHLYIAAGKLDEYANHLCRLSDAMPGAGQKPRELDIVIYQTDGNARMAINPECLLPLAAQEQGFILRSLQLEVSVRAGTSQGFARLLRSGGQLKQLAIVFVDHMGPCSTLAGQALVKGLRGRRHRLEKLELTDFHQVLGSAQLGGLLEDGPQINSLHLQLSQLRNQLGNDFRIAELLRPRLKRLQFKGLRLGPQHMLGIGRALGDSRTLLSFSIQDCMLAGQSEEIFCALTNNRSLVQLVFLRNLVQASRVTPTRLMKLLCNLAQLRELDINAFDSGEFREAAAILETECKLLTIRQHKWLVGNHLELAWRINWLPLQDELARLAEVDTPPVEEGSEDTRSVDLGD